MVGGEMARGNAWKHANATKIWQLHLAGSTCTCSALSKIERKAACVCKTISGRIPPAEMVSASVATDHLLALLPPSAPALAVLPMLPHLTPPGALQARSTIQVAASRPCLRLAINALLNSGQAPQGRFRAHRHRGAMMAGEPQPPQTISSVGLQVR
jgi:hypothetical protein